VRVKRHLAFITTHKAAKRGYEKWLLMATAIFSLIFQLICTRTTARCSQVLFTPFDDDEKLLHVKWEENCSCKFTKKEGKLERDFHSTVTEWKIVLELQKVARVRGLKLLQPSRMKQWNVSSLKL
jgi:hypothetical protein